MLIYQHFLLSIIPGIIIFYFSRLGALIFILVNVLIDSDHYPVYVLKFKDLSLKRAHKYFKDLGSCNDVALFHSIEIILLVLVFSYYYNILFFVFLGLIFHLVLDVYDAHVRGIKRYFSIIKWARGELFS